jgi:UDP-2,3-diacylglucosamine pyrophosphatase LpxH
MRTLILSDLHLGSKRCHTQQILTVLQHEPFDRLILNGDTIHSLNLKKFKDRHWRVLDRLRQLARAREMILVRGNHDCDLGAENNGFGSRDILPTLLGVPMVENYRLDVGQRPYLVCHGDQFDPILNNTLISEMAGWCYDISNKLNKRLAKWLKKKSKGWSGVLKWVRSQSIQHAHREGFDGIVTGHTHFADDLRVDDLHYINSGCWTEPPCAYVVADAGRLQLHEVPD